MGLAESVRTELGTKRRVGNYEFEFEFDRNNRLVYSTDYAFASKDEAKRAIDAVTDHVIRSVGLFMKHRAQFIVTKTDRQTGVDTYTGSGDMEIDFDSILKSI